MQNTKNKIFEFKITENKNQVRIDKYLTEKLKDYTRTYIQKLIKEELILVNDQKVKANYKLRINDHIKVKVQPLEVVEVNAENIPIDIIFEDDDLIIVNKPKGMVVHPSKGHYSGSLVNALLYHYKDNLSSINGELRPGIVHRLDMDTTGILIVCKNDRAHTIIAKQLKERSLRRTYNTIVYNSFDEKVGKIDAPIGRHPIERTRMSINYEKGKNAVTHYKLIENLKQNFAYIECDLETGRTHQIRVHMASIGHPILGDRIYGPNNKKFKLQGQALHARCVGFIHPTSNKYVEFNAPLPEYFTRLINLLSL